MNYCEIKTTQRGQTLKEMSGLSEFSVMSFINGFQQRYGRFPELDEIPRANSENYLSKQLNLKDSKTTRYTSTSKIQEVTGTSDIKEANSILNNEYKDLEVHLDQIEDAVVVETLHRPTEYSDKEIVVTDIDKTDSKTVLLDSLGRLEQYYGIDIIPITSQEITTPGFSSKNAFIKDGKIYINLDNASIDAPIHEMLHLFMGSIRFANSNLYFQLVQQTEQLPNFEQYVELFPNRSMSDVQEEIFVEQLGRYIIGEESMFDQIDPSIVNYLIYNIKRDIDSIIFGKQSVKSLSEVFGKSLLELARELGSDNFDVTTMASLDDATIHRIMANTKEELLSKNELIQECV